MQIDLPGLTQRIRLDEVALVVHMELMVDRVIFEVGDEAGDIDDRQRALLGSGMVLPACHGRERAATVAPA
jgi:hypothetical protein